jgi:DNA polymerase III alpha subunit
MKTDFYGQAIVESSDAFDALYTGSISNLNNLKFEDQQTVDQFNQALSYNADDLNRLEMYEKPGISLSEFDKNNQDQWFMPDEYRDLNIVEWMLDRTTNEEEYQRVVSELELFIQHDMLVVLNYLKYLVDTMRSNDIVWGVGRGSSVASYCLYLLGVHKVNSIKYELDITEFLR